MSSWFEPVRAYCERQDAAFWAEPLNAATNAAFLAAAVALLVREGRAPRRDPAARALALLIGVVGIGSFLFHTVAQRWAMLADVIPIGLFIYAYFGLAMRRLLGLAPGAALLATLAFAALGFGLGPALDWLAGPATERLNGSVDYLPALLALMGTGAALLARPGAVARRAGLGLLGMALLFLVSLTFRTLDRALCASLPTGTHLLWHLLNAGVLYGLVRIAMRARAA